MTIPQFQACQAAVVGEIKIRFPNLTVKEALDMANRIMDKIVQTLDSTK